MVTYIIVIVLIVIGLVKNYKDDVEKKKKAGRVKPNKPVQINKSLNSSSPSLFSKKQEKPELQRLNVPQEINCYTESVIDMPSLENVYFNEDLGAESNGSSVEIRSEESIAFDMDNNKSNTIELNLDTKDDLKKALVYSFIFERKY